MPVSLTDADGNVEKIQHLNDMKNSSVFSISSVSYQDAGVYECSAENGIQPAIKANFTLIIRGMSINYF